MRTVFADAAYWIAMLNPEDEWSDAAARVTRELGDIQLVTTQEVLGETLNFFAGGGADIRRHAVEAIREILTAENVTVVEPSPEAFLAGMDLYEASGDVSLTDCISVCTMQEEGVSEVLTNDGRFARAGLSVLSGNAA